MTVPISQAHEMSFLNQGTVYLGYPAALLRKNLDDLHFAEFKEGLPDGSSRYTQFGGEGVFAHHTPRSERGGDNILPQGPIRIIPHRFFRKSFRYYHDRSLFVPDTP